MMERILIYRFWCDYGCGVTADVPSWSEEKLAKLSPREAARELAKVHGWGVTREKIPVPVGYSSGFSWTALCPSHKDGS